MNVLSVDVQRIIYRLLYINEVLPDLISSTSGIHMFIEKHHDMSVNNDGYGPRKGISWRDYQDFLFIYCNDCREVMLCLNRIVGGECCSSCQVLRRIQENQRIKNLKIKESRTKKLFLCTGLSLVYLIYLYNICKK